MSSVGSCLHDLRLKHGFSLAEMARSTRVTPRYLEALESDQFSELPPPVFTRGFIRAFCTTLGESPDTALALYEQHLEVTQGPRPTAPRRDLQSARVPATERPRGRSAVFVSFVLLVALGAALFTVVVTLQGRRESADRRDVAMARGDAPPERAPVVTDGADQPTPAPVPPTPSTAPPPQDSPAPRVAGVTDGTTPARPETSAPPAASPVPGSPGSPVTAPGGPAAAAAPATPSTVGPAVPWAASSEPVSSPYRLVAKTRALTWLRVRTEGGKATEENVPAGEVREWVSNRPFVVTVGNAGGVSFELNGRPLPPLGGDGAVVREIVVPGER